MMGGEGLTIQGLYSELIHGKYYPPRARGTIPGRYQAIISSISVRRAPVNSVLEIGPEEPGISEFMVQSLGIRPSQYECVDISEQSVKLLQTRGFRATTLDVSTERFPFGDSRFSVVIMSEVIEHLINPDHALSEIHRSLADDGLLILTTPNLASWYNRLLLLAGFQPVFSEISTIWTFGRPRNLPMSRPVGHIRMFTPRALEDLLSFHGFDIVRTKGLATPGEFGVVSLLKWFDRRMTTLPHLSAELLVVATRRTQLNATGTGRSAPSADVRS